MDDNSELAILGDAARRLLADYPQKAGVHRAELIDAAAVDTAMRIAIEQGWLGVSAQEELGGLNMGASAAIVLATEIGRALLPGPIMAATVLLPGLARQSPAFLPLAEAALVGTCRVSLAVRMARRGEPGQYIADHAAGATDILVVEQDMAGETVFRWFRDGSLSARAPFDPTCPVAELRLGAVEPTAPNAAVTLPGSSAEQILGPVHLWIAAELLGIAERAGEMAVNHAKERKQFDQFIGAYQGVKHRLVDDYVLRETAGAIIKLAAERWDAGESDKVLLAHAARAAASQAALSATAYCIQVHGGLGVSWEHSAHLYYKRARRLVALLGSTDASLTAIADAIAIADTPRSCCNG